MKITTLQTYVVRTTLGDQAFGWSQRVGNSRQTAICVVTTDEGFHGVGEAFYFGGPATIAAQIIEEALGPLILEQDPLDNAVLWDRLYNWTRDQGQKGVTISALSAIDIALWDIKGKALNLPVYKLLGGAYRTRAKVYATGLYEPQSVTSVVNALTEEAVGYRDQGFRGMKLKIGYDPETDLDYIQAVRNAIGDEIALMVDANHAYNANEAIRLARAMEPYGIEWFEEPVPPEDLEGYQEVKANTDILIAGG